MARSKDPKAARPPAPAQPPEPPPPPEADMSEFAPAPRRPFDVNTVQTLVRLMTRHGLTEIDLHEGDQRIRLRKGGPRQAASPPYAAHVPTPAPVVPPPPTTVVPAEPPAPPAKATVPIKSESIGTFYAARKEGAPPLVKVGDRITPDTVVGILEAMKLYSDIRAECSGVIVKMLARNAQPVEYGQVLFEVEPSE